jgi:hypothetical protein
MSKFDDALSNVRTMKEDDSFVEKTKSTIKASAFGVVVGLMYGWYNQKNLYVYGLLGAIGGGLINYAFLGVKKKNNDE